MKRLLAALDPLARRLGFYTAYRLRWPEYVGDFVGGLSTAELHLRSNGYERHTLSAAKQHPERDQLAAASYRRVPTEHPAVEGTPRLFEWRPAECQYHVHLFASGSGVEVFSHYELRPDFFKPRFDPERLRTHYRPEWGEEYLLGITDLTFDT